MTKEEEFVVNPLIRWFKKEKHYDWKVYKPKYGASATGWDIEARRKNQDLLIEAKFIDGPFLSSFTGLVTAPLANRKQHFSAKRYRSWCYGVCWAIGTSYKTRNTPVRNTYQILLDYFARNSKFWGHYGKDLRMKYIFFVRDKKVAKVPFARFLEIAIVYNKMSKGNKLRERRRLAETLMKKYEYS